MSFADPARLMRFVLELRQAGVTDARTLGAMERTLRSDYAPTQFAALALDDVALPLEHGQSMTKPSLIGRMIAALAPESGESILEIGTGSGYQAAILASLAHKVVTLERQRSLAADARGRIGAARLMRVYVHAADGAEGWVQEAPYDRIVVNASLADIPQALLDQLKPGGTLLAPINARLIRLRNDQREDLGPIEFAPLARGVEEG